MTKKGLNANHVKMQNRSKILRILRNEREISRKDLSDQMSLTKAAITGIVGEMMEEELIVERGYQESGVIGRKKVLLEINRKFGYVLGLSISETHFVLSLNNILAETIDTHFHAFDGEAQYEEEELVGQVVEKSLRILWDNGIDKSAVLGFGISYIGVKDNLHMGQIEEKIKSSLQLRVVSENNVKALAIAQMDFARQMMSEDFLFVKYGPGLGMSIIQNGRIVYGHNNTAGEIGHTLVDTDADTTCRCGRRGCLESLISEKGIVKDIERLGEPYSHLVLDRKLYTIDYPKVNELMEKGDGTIINIFEPRYDYFAKALVNSIILFDPEYVCVYGQIFNQRAILEMIREKVDAYLGVHTKVKIKLSNLDPKNSALGPAALALRTFFYDSGGSGQAGQDVTMEA
ncbi:ROK family transcriptional regulator [Anaerotalea alkaliphila]|uniref:ROK family transcriptional regulator n=1 Tax=Anaerotalea alkaliphila TaxID=2662126 RepID=A0A7X5HV38_9FIRM|nr:ROK family transcriptional regulator [Anaerotalea alkaliphila]NDL67001.1 ROK family transcriptional regulator [Anaerotalea alkaliphila]